MYDWPTSVGTRDLKHLLHVNIEYEASLRVRNWFLFPITIFYSLHAIEQPISLCHLQT